MSVAADLFGGSAVGGLVWLAGSRASGKDLPGGLRSVPEVLALWADQEELDAAHRAVRRLLDDDREPPTGWSFEQALVVLDAGRRLKNTE